MSVYIMNFCKIMTVDLLSIGCGLRNDELLYSGKQYLRRSRYAHSQQDRLRTTQHWLSTVQPRNMCRTLRRKRFYSGHIFTYTVDGIIINCTFSVVHRVYIDEFGTVTITIALGYKLELQ